MSKPNAEVVRAGFEAMGRGDLPGLLELIDPAVEWTVRPDLPDAGVYRGHEELLRLIERFAEVLDDQWFEPQEFIEGPGETVVVLVHWGGRGRSSGMEIASRQDEAWVFTVHNGKVVRVTEYGHKHEALEAVGISGEKQ
jgi:ketosteroid isomerase-like protein